MEHEERLRANGPMAETAQKAKELGEGLSHAADALYHRAETTLEELKKNSSRTLERAYDEGRKQVRQVSRQIQDDPIKSVLLAAGAGLLAGLFLQRRSAWRSKRG
ncbi:MAG: DUF883 family protein [Proteobacteria bacterium]|nr:DUF883 family protein [Pseudomonadota bacterium]